MSINTAHRGDASAVVLFYGERLLIFYDGCDFKLGAPLKGSHEGRLYLTSHRVIFINKQKSAGLQSFSMPFICMREVEIKQPVFGANRITGKVKAEVNGGWIGVADFDMVFNRGGAIEFGQALIELGRRACSAQKPFQPPPYTADCGAHGAVQYYACLPPTFMPPYHDSYYGFVAQNEAFTAPAADSVYHSSQPPPYPGAAPYPTATAANGQPFNPTAATATPSSSAGPGAPGARVIAESQYQSAAHAAKAAEAGELKQYSTAPGFYFRENPHTVYTQPSAPPNAPTGSSAQAYDELPPSYSESVGTSGPTDPHTKKNQ